MSVLTQRQKQILKRIVDDYISNPDPVASRTVSRHRNISYSPATVRNEMMELEDKGYLTQPHSSSGRIPTNLAYRFYINYLMELEQLSREEEQKISEIRREYENRRSKIREVLKNTSQLLSSITGLPGMTLTPSYGNAHFLRLKMLGLGDCRVLVLLQTSEGVIENLIIRTEKEITQEKLDDISEKLSSRIRGFKLEDLKKELENLIREEADEMKQELSSVLNLLKNGVESLVSRRDVVVEGASHLVSIPEFRDTKKLEVLLKLLDQKDELIRILNRCVQADGVNVLIGGEVDESLSDVAVISAPYHAAGQKCCGKIGILGPSRVQYSRVITAVSEISKQLTEILENL